MSEHDDDNPFRGVPDPDWGRYETRSRAVDTTGASHSPLGDPTRWGAVESVDLATAGETVISSQILRVQCSDNYSRAWSIVGTVTANALLWALPADEFVPKLLIRMGVGQNVVEHQVNLRAVIDADAPFYGILGPPVAESHPFVMPGGIIGNAINVSASVFVFGAIPAAPGNKVSLAVQLAPFNAGSGL